MTVTRRRSELFRWPSWRYGPDGESGIFNSEEEVPTGWTRKPGVPFVQAEQIQLDREDLVAQLTTQGIEVNPTWGKAHMKKVLDDSRTPR